MTSASEHAQMPQPLVQKATSAAQDERLINALKQGDAQAVQALYEAFAATAYGVIVGIVETEHQAQEVLQGIFVAVSREIVALPKPPRSLLLLICQRARAAALECRKKVQGEAIQSTENTVGLNREEQSSALDLIWKRGYTYAEAAESLQISGDELRRQVRQELQAFKAGGGDE